MTDENYLRDADEDTDPAALAFAAEALARLAFLRPDAPEAGVAPDGSDADTMPDWTWERISRSLAAESEIRAKAAPSAGSTPRHASRATRWGGGLIAASVAVVAVGIGFTAMRGTTSDSAVVAGEVSAASTAADAEAFGAAPASPGSSALTAQDLEGPSDWSFAGMVPPAQMLVDSGLDYTRTRLGAQVRSVLDRFGASSAQAATKTAPVVMEAAEMPATGFMASEQALRDCITKLTNLAESTAVMVDRSSFEGQDAGVVVAPEYADPASASPTPDMSRMQVWVIDPDCNVTTAIELTMAP